MDQLPGADDTLARRFETGVGSFASLAPATSPVVRAGSAELIPHPSWQASRDRALAAVLAGLDRIVVSGPAGTGKSVLLRDLARLLRSMGRDVVLTLAARVMEGETSAPPGAVLLIDDADRLATDTVEGLRARTGRIVVLAGLPALAERCSGFARVALGPIPEGERPIFVRLWMEQSGRPQSRLEPDAATLAASLSDGVPRLLASLLCSAFWIADSESAPAITAAHVQSAADLRRVERDDDDTLVPGAKSPHGAQSGAIAPAAREVALPFSFPALDDTVAPWRRRPALVVVAACLAVTAGAALVQQAGWSLQRPRTAVPESPAASSPSVAETASLPIPPAPVIKEVATAAPNAGPASAAPAPPPVIEEKPALAAAERRLEVPAARVSEPPKSAQEPLQQAAADPAPAPVASEPAPALSTPVAMAAIPPAPGSPAVPIAVAAPTPTATLPPVPVLARASETVAAVALSATSQQSLVETLIRRGDETLALGDVSAARLLYLRAASLGSGAGATAVGRTFDPTVLAELGADIAPDPEQATEWYHRGSALGDDRAGVLLAALGRAPAR